MRLCRFNQNRLGVMAGDRIKDVSQALDALPALRWPVPLGDQLVANLAILVPIIMELLPQAPEVGLKDVMLDSPVANPSKIIGAPLNYRAHAEEIDDSIGQGHSLRPIGEWGLFLKASSALVGPSAGIIRRFPNERTDYEIELVVIIGRRANRVSRSAAMSYVAGYAVGLDITLRGPQFQSFRKSIDTYAVVGPCLVTVDEVDSPANLELELILNGKVAQKSNTGAMIFDVPRLIEFASDFYTLEPGDMIMTGTPHGVGPIKSGDVLSARIEGIGVMDVIVRGE